MYDAVQQQQAGDPRHVGEILVEKGSVKPQDLLDALNLQQEVRGAKAVSAMSAGPFGAEAFHLLLFREFMNAHNDPNLSKRQI